MTAQINHQLIIIYLSFAADKDSAPPVFTAVPKSRTVLAGTDIVLECSAVAHPNQPRIMWLKEGGALDFRYVHFALIFFSIGIQQTGNNMGIH